MSDEALAKLREAVKRLPKNSKCNANREVDILVAAFDCVNKPDRKNVLGKYVLLELEARRLVEQVKETK